MHQERPNILLIMTDQQRFDSLGCYGSKAVPTPHLDRLAATGCLFENAYVPNTICTPSRASLMTGKTVPQHGVQRLYDNLSPAEVCFPRRLQERGYQTALFGKFHVSSRFSEAKERHPHDGFDIYEWCHDPALHHDSPFNAYSQWLQEQDPAFREAMIDRGRRTGPVPRDRHMTHWAAERTIDFITRRRTSQPFFCFMSLFDPHDPYDDGPEELLQIVDEGSLMPPAAVQEPLGDKPLAVQRASEAAYPERDAESKLLAMRRGYYASISLIDQEVGRVLQALDDSGCRDSTLVIFSSDHGDMLGDHRLLTKGGFFYDACSRVPLIMRWPQQPEAAGGRRRQQLVQTQDITATILAAAAYSSRELTAWMPDACPLFTGHGARTRRQEAVSCFRTNRSVRPEMHAVMIRDDRYKLSLYYYLDEGHPVDGELYDMDEDPGEVHNLWHHSQYCGIKHDLTVRLSSWWVQQLLCGETPGGSTTAESRKGAMPHDS